MTLYVKHYNVIEGKSNFLYELKGRTMNMVYHERAYRLKNAEVNKAVEQAHKYRTLPVKDRRVRRATWLYHWQVAKKNYGGKVDWVVKIE